MVALSKKVADKLKRGEQPTDVELRDLFGLDPRHTYVKQSAVGQFLVDYMGVSRNKIRASLGAAAGRLAQLPEQRQAAIAVYLPVCHQSPAAGKDLCQRGGRGVRRTGWALVQAALLQHHGGRSHGGPAIDHSITWRGVEGHRCTGYTARLMRAFSCAHGHAVKGDLTKAYRNHP